MEKIMAEGAPDLIAINHDDYHAEHVGRTVGGQQFFLTTPFAAAVGDDARREFIALYLFDAKGDLLEARIDDLGTREQADANQARALIKTRLEELGEFAFGNIEVAPFRVERFGVEFGLIPRAPEAEDEKWWVTVEPGDYMAFYPPWDGDYDT